MKIKTQARLIANSTENAADKIKQLEEIVLDCYNEMEAQDQNMHPEIQNEIDEGLRVAKNLLRKLKEKV